jgi:hypothetical protein
MRFCWGGSAFFPGLSGLRFYRCFLSGKAGKVRGKSPGEVPEVENRRSFAVVGVSSGRCILSWCLRNISDYPEELTMDHGDL